MRLRSLSAFAGQLAALAGLVGCVSQPRPLTGSDDPTKRAILEYRLCAAKEVDRTRSIPMSDRERAVSAEKSCLLQREAVREALEQENIRGRDSSDRFRSLALGFADAATRLMQTRLIEDLVLAQAAGPQLPSIQVAERTVHACGEIPQIPPSLIFDPNFKKASVTIQFEQHPGVPNAREVKVIRSSGYAMLDDAAVTAVSKWQCRLSGDSTQIVKVVVPFDFVGGNAY